MPTINQLIRIERKAVVKRKKTPALQACPQRLHPRLHHHPEKA